VTTTDVLYIAWNRLEFTRFSFAMLLENTDWTMVERLVVCDDGSTDGTAEILEEMIAEFGDADERPAAIEFWQRSYGGPVAFMNEYVESSKADRFAKIDNDIVVPAGWLEALSDVMDANPHVEILGMEAGRMGVPRRDGQEWDGVYRPEPARWIGGVGLIQTRTLGERPKMNPNGRFGWTEWQREYLCPNRIAWISPDLALCELSRIPFEPWFSLSNEYRAVEVKDWKRPDNLERDWPRYHERWCEFYWGWWRP